MSLRSLPKIKAFEAPVQWDTPTDALAKWDSEVRGASDDSTITIYDVIGSDGWTEGVTAKRISAALRSIGKQDVTVSINSPGGDFFEGLAIYNLLREHPYKVTVKVVGLAASAASIIAMAGDEIEVAKSGFLMIHNAWVIALGNRHDMAGIAETLAQFDDAMAEVYAARSELDKAEIAKMMDDETWMSGQTAVDKGFATSLLSADEITAEANASVPKDVLARRHMEAALAKEGMGRKQRAELINTLSGQRDATRPAERDAGELSGALEGFLLTLRG